MYIVAGGMTCRFSVARFTFDLVSLLLKVHFTISKGDTPYLQRSRAYRLQIVLELVIQKANYLELFK